MFGSKNSELTRKYETNWFEAMTFGFHSRWRVAYSTNPIATNVSASAVATPKHHSASRPSQRVAARSLKSSRNGT